MRCYPYKLIVFAFVFIGMKATSFTAQDAPKPPLPEDKQIAQISPDASLNLDMNLDQLSKQNVVVPGLSTEVSTVERHASTIGRSPNAVFVITNEMIKRSGARSIPDALRMAPGLHVARINGSTYAITARGYNDKIANFLLVQIDGRVVYQGTFGGVYWNQQDVVLADVERIEVVRGPGTTMWGSNAVNGVINIITKNTQDTQGELVQGGGGVGQERGFVTGRHGGTLNSTTTYRVFGQQFDNSPGFSETNNPDAWHLKHAGFRIDSVPNKNEVFTVQGDLLDGNLAQQFHDVASPTFPYSIPYQDVTTSTPAANMLMRYTRTIDEDTSWQLQSYYDHYEQNNTYLGENRNTYDFDLQCRFRPADRHHFITGANYRNSADKMQNTFVHSFLPASDVTQWISVYGQDTMTLEEDRWYFTLGCRLEQHSIGGLQAEPTARLLFLPSERQSVWAAVSRAVRNPTRLDRDFYGKLGTDPNNPVYAEFIGNPFHPKPENVVSYELGYRAAPTEKLTWDIAGFANEYNDAFSAIAGDPFVTSDGVIVPIVFGNENRTVSYGFETTATRQMREDWRISCSYSVIEFMQNGNPYITAAPHNQVYLQSSWDFDGNKQFDLIGRYVDSLGLGVPSYYEMDARYGWQLTETLEFSFFGRNLLDSHHLEYAGDVYVSSTEARRSWYAMLTWKY